jgi:hypothetical protein
MQPWWQPDVAWRSTSGTRGTGQRRRASDWQDQRKGAAVSTRPHRRRALAGAAAVAAVGVLLLAGCNTSDSLEATGEYVEAEPAGGAAVAPEEGKGEEDGATGDSAGGGDSAGTTGAVDTPLQDRAVISTVDLVVEVEDVGAASTRAATVAAQFGGYVQSESTGLTPEPLPVEPDPLSGEQSPPVVTSSDRALVVLRVPSDRADDAVAALEALGETVSRSRSTEDVTEQVVDVRTRISTQRAAIDRLEQLLADATDVEDVLAVESELTRRIAELESLEARQQQLANLTSLATISATFAPPQTVVEEGTGFVAGLEAGWRAFVRALELALTATGALLPFAVFAGLVLTPVVIWLVLRQRRSRARAADAATAPAAQEHSPAAPVA